MNKKSIKKFKKYLVLGMLLGILLLGLFLRTNNLFTWPRLGATFDEYAWTWQGMNLIQKGVPVSWSPHPQYKNAKDITYRKTHFRIVKPFLEHPPVFGLVAGAFAILNGASDMYHLTIVNIRPLAVVLGVLSILIVYLLTREIYDEKTGLIAALLYSTIPTIVIGSRIVQNENFFIPVWLLSLWLVVEYIKNEYKNKNLLYFAAILCYLLVLAKIPWIAGSGSIFLIFLYLKKYKDAALFVIAPILALITFFAYGFFYDSHTFLSLWGLQLNRYDIIFTSIFALFQKPYLVDRFYTDGWIYFGWIAYFLLLVSDLKKNYIIVLALLSYFVVFLAGIPDEPGHGWYRYPFYPLLIISTALFIREYFAKNLILTFAFLIWVGTALLGLTWEVVFGFSYMIFRIAIVTWGLTLAPLFFKGKKWIKLSRVLSYGWFIILILLNIWAVLLYNEQ